MCGCLLRAPYWGAWPQTQPCALTGNETRDPLMCRPALNPLSQPNQGGKIRLFFKTNFLLLPQFTYLLSLPTPFFIPLKSASGSQIQHLYHKSTLSIWPSRYPINNRLLFRNSRVFSKVPQDLVKLKDYRDNALYSMVSDITQCLGF